VKKEFYGIVSVHSSDLMHRLYNIAGRSGRCCKLPQPLRAMESSPPDDLLFFFVLFATYSKTHQDCVSFTGIREKQQNKKKLVILRNEEGGGIV
jgi:hypothetical protein